MARLFLSDIAEIIEADVEVSLPHVSIFQLLIDSRKYNPKDKTVFFAINGENHDGHDYIDDLYDEGLRYFIVEEVPEHKYIDAIFLRVDNSLEALQKLAAAVRLQTKAKITAITGSNGKTIVKEWLYQLLHTRYQITRNPKSYNSQVGVPLSLWHLEKDDDLGIFEAGISQVGEMEKLQKMLQADVGILTNIGSAHDAYFQSRKQKIEEKIKLFKACKKLIYCLDQGWYKDISHPFFEGEHLSWSTHHKDCSLFVKSIQKGKIYTRLEAVYEEDMLEIKIPFTDDASIENAIHCWLYALDLGVSNEFLKKRFEALTPVAMRLELKSGIQNSIVINDSYNADLESLRVALHFLDQQGHERKKILILSDILQSGMESSVLYKEVADIIKQHQVEKLIGIGPKINLQKNLFDSRASFYPTTEAFLDVIEKHDFHDSAILLKGARDFYFEEISQKLEQKTHQTVLNIHLSALVHNLNYYRSKLGKDVKLMAMVKAFSYGSGSFEIANVLQFHQVDYLGVAYADEGVALRKMGVTLPIMVLNPEESSFEDIITYSLEPEIYNVKVLKAFSKSILNNKLDDEAYPIHLKLDTGMHRLGFEEGDISSLISLLKEMSYFRIASVFSHLAGSDEASLNKFSEQQYVAFKQMCNVLESHFGKLHKHILNSSGISHFPHYQMDMVRLGIGMYGISGNSEDQKMLQTVSELKATVSQIKKLSKGDSVGYSRAFIASKEMQIATVTVGYADGFRRSLGKGVGEVWIKGSKYPVVGNVCMDMLMVDVSHADVKEGDEVEIFGTHISIYEIAKKMETIPYEVLTGISQRVKRVYYLD